MSNSVIPGRAPQRQPPAPPLRIGDEKIARPYIVNGRLFVATSIRVNGVPVRGLLKRYRKHRWFYSSNGDLPAALVGIDRAAMDGEIREHLLTFALPLFHDFAKALPDRKFGEDLLSELWEINDSNCGSG